jgi:8-oxo-dGTP diphosphatase
LHLGTSHADFRLLPIGQYSFPGGHLDQGEEIFACAERETFEETGLKIRATKIVAVTNDVFVDADKHYISIFVTAERIDGEQQPQVRTHQIHKVL